MSRPRLLTPRFALICLSGVVYFSALSLPLSVLPVMVESGLGGTSTQVGLSVGILGASAAIVRPIIGPLGDRHGRRVIIVVGALLVALHLGLLALADSITVVIGIRLLGGFGEAAVFVGLASAIQDLTPPERRGEAASYFSLTVYGSLAIAPAVGIAVAEATDFDTVWLIGTGLAVTAALIGTSAPGRPDPIPPRPVNRSYIHPAARRPATVLFLGLLGYTGFLAFIAVHAEEVGVDNPGTVFTVHAAIVIGLRFLGAQLPDRLGPTRTTAIALTTSVIALTVLGVWRQPAGVYTGSAIMGVAQSFIFPALFVLVVVNAPDEERSHAIGSFSIAFDLAFAAGGALMGMVADASDRPTAFLAAAGVSGLTLLLSRRILGDVTAAEPVSTAGPRSRR